MVIRATFEIGDAATARVLSRQLCATLAEWGECRVLRLEPYYKDPSQYVTYVNVAVDRSGDPINLIRDVARALASSDWEFHDGDPDEAWAVWDARAGGTPTVGAATWLCIGLLPSGPAGQRPRSSTDDGPVRPR